MWIIGCAILKGTCQLKNPRIWGKPLLVLHLFFCCVWLYLFETTKEPPDWTVILAYWSILGIQFTWGFTVGLIVGPSRSKRINLWWSLLLSFLPLYFLYWIAFFIGMNIGVVWGVVFFLTFVALIGCETFGGVLLGAKAHLAVKEGGE